MSLFPFALGRMQVHTHIFIHVCTNAYMCTRTHAMHTHICMHVHTHTHIIPVLEKVTLIITYQDTYHLFYIELIVPK
jgi:hypothetical protein